MENYIWTMIMASWTPLIIHDSYELQTSMISDHSKWGFIRFTRSMITHDCYEHWLWAITVHRNSYEFGFWTINDQTHHTWWGGINAMKCWCSYMINTDSVSYYDPYWERSTSLTSRCNVGYHVAYKEGNLYPINALRNLALEQAATDYVFLTDIDFLPSTYAVSSLAASTRSLLLSRPLRSYSQL